MQQLRDIDPRQGGAIPAMRRIGRKNLPLNALRAFEAVASANSFTRGAQHLSVTQSAVSRHVTELEAFLGTKLFERAPQGISLTSAGHDLLSAVHRSLNLLETAVEQALRKDNIRIYLPPAFLQAVALDVIREFHEMNTGVSIDVISENGIGRMTDDVDLAVVVDHIRPGAPPEDLLWHIRCMAVCAPSVAPRLVQSGLGAVIQSNELLHSKLPGEASNMMWRRYAESAGLDIDHDRGLAFDSMTLAVDTAMAGGGIALADVNLFADRLKKGLIVAPFTHVAESGLGYFLRVNPKRAENRIVRQFQSTIIARFAGFRADDRDAA